MIHINSAKLASGKTLSDFIIFVSISFATIIRRFFVAFGFVVRNDPSDDKLRGRRLSTCSRFNETIFLFVCNLCMCYALYAIEDRFVKLIGNLDSLSHLWMYLLVEDVSEV